MYLHVNIVVASTHSLFCILASTQKKLCILDINFQKNLLNGAKEVTSERESNMADMAVHLHCTIESTLMVMLSEAVLSCRPYLIPSYLTVHGV